MNTQMKFNIFIITFYLSLILSTDIVNGQSSSCSCSLESAGMTMICTNVHSLAAFQQCAYEQLNVQSDLKLRRGGFITNLTIIHHSLRNLSPGFLNFTYGNINYVFNDLRYLYVIRGTLKAIESGALRPVESALEYLDLSNNEMVHIPRNTNEQYTNLM